MPRHHHHSSIVGPTTKQTNPSLKNRSRSPTKRVRLRIVSLSPGRFLAAVLGVATFLTATSVVYQHRVRSVAEETATGGRSSVGRRRAASASSSVQGDVHRQSPPSSPVLHNPDQFRDPSVYVNLPINPESDIINRRVDEVIAAANRNIPPEPYGLLHEAHPPGKDVIMGLAAYPRNMDGFKKIVRSLRNSGYDGHIIFGVHVNIPENEARFLRNNDVTYYGVEFVDCDKTIMDDEDDGGAGAIRGKCSKGLEDLKLEWGRFEMNRQWLNRCKDCTGWTMVMDTRDIFFQRHPFESLPHPPETAQRNLLFIEEIAPYTNPRHSDMPWRAETMNNGRYVGRTEPCYGKRHWKSFADRPILCSGTVIGTRSGMDRFLSVLVNEFRTNNRKKKDKNIRGGHPCRLPKATDQWTMNYLYYTGAFGYQLNTTTIPWGTGPILTIGAPCVNNKIKHTPENPNHSQKDLVEFGSGTADAAGEGKDGGGGGGEWILNTWEQDGSPARVAPGVHQYDRCFRWFRKWRGEHKSLFDVKGTDRYRELAAGQGGNRDEAMKERQQAASAMAKAKAA